MGVWGFNEGLIKLGGVGMDGRCIEMDLWYMMDDNDNDDNDNDDYNDDDII